MLERGAGSRFLPGYVAFPGGSTDREDLVLAERWFGTREEAARACAVRELFEEVGLALTAEGLTEAKGRSLDSLSESPPSSDQLPEIVHWVAPERGARALRRPVLRDRLAGRADPRPRRRGDGRRVVGVAARTPGGVAHRAAQAVLADLLHDARDRAVPPTSRELLALRVDPREPDEDDVARYPRATFWQD